MESYSAYDGETVDSLLYRTTGSTNGIEAVLFANPQQSINTVLSAGETIVLPQAIQLGQATSNQQLIQLWD